ncbi:transcriptional regulator [Brachybacterium ginsengisoli]|uniref:Transcriptional regulator n=1 Tax=Brachybacterium ginsengisoli TaxID=1331682 RepID=A0A291GU43_9MICO|nr:ROK family transcriptional regulator [Brachybacterium ginsengisoli]ATG53729.1 transcriptional regulator [Brachybacterium ginsengisoli]
MTQSGSPSRGAGRGSRRAVPVGHAVMRSANLSLLLRHLHTRGGRSRATLAQETGLSKAAVTSLVGDLAERGLVQEGELERRGTVGRPGTEVRIAPHHVAGIGVELNVDYLAVCLLDLSGEVRFSTQVPTPYELDDGAPEGRAYPPALLLDGVAEQLRVSLAAAEREGLWVSGITVAPPGPIDYEGSSVRLASNLGWADVPLGEELAARLGPDHPELALENDAKLSALAEAPRLARRGITDLVYLTGDIGVGAGIIAGGRLVRGWSGFSGEVGHIGLDPAGERCRCGRRGCWETMVGFGTVLAVLDEDDPARSGRLPMAERLARIRTLLDAEDPRLQQRFTSLVDDLVRGVGVLVDVLNPQAIVLGGYFGHFADLLVGPVQSALDARLLAADGRVEVSGSVLGLDAAAAGGAAVALERVLEDPLLAPVLPA